MHSAQDFVGGVYHASLPNGRATGSVEIDIAGIRVRTADGATFLVPFADLDLELGGSTGGVVFCHGRDRETTIYTADPEFLPSLATNLDSEVSECATRILASRTQRRWSRRGVITTAVLVMVVLAMTTPTLFGWMVERTVRALPTSIDRELGEVVVGQLKSTMTVVDVPVVRTAMDAILERLEEHIPDDYEAWDFRVMVVDDDSINAFALPGGQMVFHSGLLIRAGSAEEVAGVMAHEMGHVLERHSLQHMAQSLGIVAGVGLMFGDTGVLIAAAAEFITMAAINQYSRADEAEADAISVAMMHRAGLDPGALSEMFERMKDAGADLPDALHWISTHPSHDERIDAIGRQIQKLDEVETRPLDIDWAAVRRALAK
jgi:predicted Zn-dependent protease